ncbi:phospholipase [Lacticaseibacillus paracasei]|uniref:phospholipase n=1 Tax=Lacticaseibacillus paracasei TaxID=1597 RepID=UPI001CBD1EF3|nr:phospholipase [Lacticaseibacillus paracasei]MBZ3798230.1 phospholipase [Lacticaseibacillus paracasei]
MKRIIVLLGIVIGIVLCSGKSVSASENVPINDTYTNEQRKAIETVEKFIEYDDKGIPEVNVSEAYRENPSEMTLLYANQINSLSRSVKTDGVEKTVGRIKRALFPIGSWENYCGKGNNGWSKNPVDNLDAACREHDKCFKGFSMKSAACNRAFIKRLLPIVQRGGFSAKGLYASAAITLFKHWT